MKLCHFAQISKLSQKAAPQVARYTYLRGHFFAQTVSRQAVLSKAIIKVVQNCYRIK